MTYDISRMGTRLGVAALTRVVFEQSDTSEIKRILLQRVMSVPPDAGALMDLAVLAQLEGAAAHGAELQRQALSLTRWMRTARHPNKPPRLRVLAMAAETEMGGNTPVEFLLDGSIELTTLYVDPTAPPPHRLPPHDVAFVIAPVGVGSRAVLDAIQAICARHGITPLNRPSDIRLLERDRLPLVLSNIAGVETPPMRKVSRHGLARMAAHRMRLSELLPGMAFPLIVRPVDSHAGAGLEKVDDRAALDSYLNARSEDEFFASPFVDYRSDDGQFRKQRVIFVEGRAYPCHMAIGDSWKLWYLNAGMAADAPKRAEEAEWFASFDTGFGARHGAAFDAICARVPLDYFGIDCAETVDGRLLVFEGDNALIVHDMDPVDVYPYKSAPMQALFDAVQAMLSGRARPDLGAQATRRAG